MRKLTKNLKIAFLIFLSGILFFSLANAVTVSHKKTPKVKAENLIAYNQMDSRWKNLTHGNYSGDTTIGSNGCGILSLVNAINYYNAISDVKGAIDEIATCASSSEYGNAYNTTSSGDGMIGSWFYPKLPGSKLGNKYGIYSVGTVFHEGKSTDSTLKNHCAVRGQFAIVNVLYHYIAVVEYDATTDKYLVLNSSQGYSANGTSTPENGGVKWYATSELNGALTAGMSIRSYSLLAIKINDNSNRENTVLGKASTGWDTTKLYDYSSENFDDREVLLNSSAFTGDNEINFVQSNSPKIEVGATFEVVDKLKSELWGKFGISFIGADGVGILFYANAQGTTGSNLESVTGTSVGYVLRNPSIPITITLGELKKSLKTFGTPEKFL